MLEKGGLPAMGYISAILMFISASFLIGGLLKKKPAIKQRFKRKVDFLKEKILPNIKDTNHQAELESLRVEGYKAIEEIKDIYELAIRYGSWSEAVISYLKTNVNDQILTSSFENIGSWSREDSKKYDNH